MADAFKRQQQHQHQQHNLDKLLAYQLIILGEFERKVGVFVVVVVVFLLLLLAKLEVQ